MISELVIDTELGGEFQDGSESGESREGGMFGQNPHTTSKAVPDNVFHNIHFIQRTLVMPMHQLS